MINAEKGFKIEKIMINGHWTTVSVPKRRLTWEEYLTVEGKILGKYVKRYAEKARRRRLMRSA